MLLPKDRRFVRGYSDSAVVETAKAAVVITYATALLNNGSYIAASDQVPSASNEYREEMERLNQSNFVDKWSVPDDYVDIQTLPKNITHYLSN